MARKYFRNSWGYGVISISSDWIRRLVPRLSGRWGIFPNFAENATVPSFGALLQPNGATFENGELFFRKRDNRPTFC